jgi:hypothetical protein
MEQMPQESNSENVDTPKPINSKESLAIDFETIEREVLKKISNINEAGTAFTGIREKTSSRKESVVSVLESGVLGTYGLKKTEIEQPSNPLKDTLKEKWVHSRKKGYGGNLFVNIVGRDTEDISHAFPFTANGGRNNIYFGFVMDISSFKELIPISVMPYYHLDGQKMKEGKGRARYIRSYWGRNDYRESRSDLASGPEADYGKLSARIVSILEKLGVEYENINFDELIDLLNKHIDSCEQFSMNQQEYSVFLEKVKASGSIQELFQTKNLAREVGSSEGFLVGHRIPPRYLKGIVVDPGFDLNININDLVDDAVQAMTTATQDKKKDSFLPVYNIFGDLLWPHKISSNNLKQVMNGSMILDDAIKQGIPVDELKQNFKKHNQYRLERKKHYEHREVDIESIMKRSGIL